MRLSLLRAALPVSLAALVMSAPAFAQAPPPPPGAPPPPLGAPPPPPRSAGGPWVILDHNGGFVHVDVHCGPGETTQACIDLATRLYNKMNGVVQPN